MKFKIEYPIHERNARRLLVDKKIKPVDQVAFLSSTEVEDIINENFAVIGYDENLNFYELITKKDYELIKSKVVTIKRG